MILKQCCFPKNSMLLSCQMQIEFHLNEINLHEKLQYLLEGAIILGTCAKANRGLHVSDTFI